MIAPPAAKRKRTTKKVSVEVRLPLFWSPDYSYFWQISPCAISD
jgi:hypothetical protein